MTVRHLGCCVCGEDAGTFEQHWNRDSGYGVCASCVDWLRAKARTAGPGPTPGEMEAEIRDLYGIEGVNFAAPEARSAPVVTQTRDDDARFRLVKIKGRAK